jgi:hypothetical protein
MANNIIDISKQITNSLPMVRVTEDIVATVNNRKSTILNMQLMVREQENKSKKKSDKGEYDEMAFMEKVLEMLIGKKTAKEINDLDLPLPEYKIVYEAVMAAATGRNLEEVQKDNSRFR